MMNYDEAIKALESRYAGYGDKGELVLAYDSKQIATIKSAIETAKKEHELLGLYRKHYELSKNPRKNENHNEIRPYIEWANDINKLEGFIIELEVELTELERELE